MKKIYKKVVLSLALISLRNESNFSQQTETGFLMADSTSPSGCDRAPPGDPFVNCHNKFVAEGKSLECVCDARFTDSRPDDFSLTWPPYSDISTMKVMKVTRDDNSTVFTCLMTWCGHQRTTNYTLLVAYGPDSEHTRIHGPDSFITDGTLSLNLTCLATEVYPAPFYTWEGVTCQNNDSDTGTCQLKPTPPGDDGRQVECTARSTGGDYNVGRARHKLNLSYPPRQLPNIYILNEQTVIDGDIIYCAVSGGRPLVTSVIFTCLSYEPHEDQPDTRTSSSVLSPLVISIAKIKGNRTKCICHAVWEPQKEWYSSNTTVFFFIQTPEKAPPQNPVINCSTLIPEGQSGTCECRLAPGDDLPDGYSLTWPGHSNLQVMQMRNVQRLDNGRTFTCLLSYDGLVLSTTYTLQVAYGPEEEHMRIVGPDKFITDGTMKLTLTCNATEVHPSPSYTWSLDRCEVREMDGKSTCSFVPRPRSDDGLVIQCIATNIRTQKKAASNISLDFQYPPLYPPIIDGVREDQGLIAGTILFCNVSGGKPLVSKVIFTCQEPPLDDEEDFVDGKTVSSPLTFNVTLTSTDAIKCTCHAVWSPRPELFTMVHEFGGFEIKQSSFGMMFIILVSAASATVFFVILIFVAGICCWRRRRATNKGREENESKQTASLQENDIDKKTAGKNEEKESEESVSLHKNVIDEKTGEQNENDSLITLREAKTETSI